MFRDGERVFLVCPYRKCKEAHLFKYIDGSHCVILELNVETNTICTKEELPAHRIQFDDGVVAIASHKILHKLPPEPTGSWREVFTIIGWEPSKIFSRPTEK